MTRRGLVALTIISIRAPEPLASKMEDISLCRSLGKAEVTYYGDGFHGKEMANGEIFDKNDPTIAASPNLPIGRRVRLTHFENKTSVVLTIKDRMPEDTSPDSLDISEAAARVLGIIREGRVRLTVEELY